MSGLKTPEQLFNELKATPNQIQIGNTVFYVVEGDLLLDETELFAYATRRAAEERARAHGLEVQREGLVVITYDHGRVVRWKKGLVLTYTVLLINFEPLHPYYVVLK